MRQILTVLLCVLSIQTVLAEKEYLIDFHDDSTQYTNLGFFIQEVTDHRKDKDNIGYVWAGFFEVKRPVNFKSGLESSFKNYLSNLISFKDGSIPIKIRIRELLISERDFGFYQEGYCQLVMEYFDSGENLLYMTDYSDRFTALDPSKKHEESIRRLINKSILAFSLYDNESKIYKDLLDQPRLYDSLILCSVPQKGFYANFKEFQANNPSLTLDFETITVEEKGNKYGNIRFPESPIDVNTLFELIYGFSDGVNIYLKRYHSDYSYSIIPVQISGRYCYMGKKPVNQAVPIILPGLFGILSLPVEEDYILDVNTGGEYLLNDETLLRLLKPYEDLYNAYVMRPPENRIEMGLFWLQQINKKHFESLQ